MSHTDQRKWQDLAAFPQIKKRDMDSKAEMLVKRKALICINGHLYCMNLYSNSSTSNEPPSATNNCSDYIHQSCVKLVTASWMYITKLSLNLFHTRDGGLLFIDSLIWDACVEPQFSPNTSIWIQTRLYINNIQLSIILNWNSCT